MRKYPLPDIANDDAYRTPPERRERALRGWLAGTPLRLYTRYVFLVVWSGIMFLIGRDPQEMVTLQSRRVMRITEKNGADFGISGLSRFHKKHGPYVFACNHMGSLDVNALPGLVASRTPMTFVVKTGLLKTPFFGKVLRRLRAIPVDRRHPGEDLLAVLEKGSQTLAEGVSVILFPEGTRHRSFRPSRFNSLAVKLAVKAGVPVVPVALKTDFWGNGKKIKDFGPVRPEEPVRIEFGDPVRPVGRGREEHRRIVDFITEKLRSWGVEIEEDNA